MIARKKQSKFFPQNGPISCFYKGKSDNGGFIPLSGYAACIDNIVFIGFATQKIIYAKKRRRSIWCIKL